MKITISKQIFQEKINRASRFSFTKVSSSSFLHGGLLKFHKNRLEITTTNLNDFFYTSVPIEKVEKHECVVDIKKIGEFLSFISSDDLILEIKDTILLISSDKTTGSFPLISSEDFPKLPSIEGREYSFQKDFFDTILPLVLFATSSDEARPILTGVNFSFRDGQKYIAATDGFRLSLYIQEEKNPFPEITISSQVLSELMRMKLKTIKMTCSEKEKIVVFSHNEDHIFSRIIDGDFPPYEKVIPTECVTKVVVNREQFLRNVKLSSVFARDFSHIILLHLQKDGIMIKPRTKEDGGTVIHQIAEIEGPEQKIAFNYKFVLDFLNGAQSDTVIFEMVKSSAPSVFRIPNKKDFLHIIMPVRTDEEEELEGK